MEKYCNMAAMKSTEYNLELVSNLFTPKILSYKKKFEKVEVSNKTVICTSISKEQWRKEEHEHFKIQNLSTHQRYQIAT